LGYLGRVGCLSQYFSYIINVSFILIEIAENSSPSVNKRQRKPKEQSRMDIPETQATWDTRHRTRTNKTNKR
jgi:hypothetical protein